MYPYGFNQLAINSTTAVAAEAKVIPALPATVVVEFVVKWSNLCPRTVAVVSIEYSTCERALERAESS